jgi:hypothetical protein
MQNAKGHDYARANLPLADALLNFGSCILHWSYLRLSIIRPELESDGIMLGASPLGAASAGAVGARDGRPRSTVRRIASAIGMCTVPALRSIHP